MLRSSNGPYVLYKLIAQTALEQAVQSVAVLTRRSFSRAADAIFGLHDEALLSLSKTPLAGRLALGLTEDTACTDLARILGRFWPLHPNVSVRTRVRMSLVLRAMLERGELDAAIIQVFSHEVRAADVVLYREDLHWGKHPDLALPAGRFDSVSVVRRRMLLPPVGADIGQDDAVLETVFECSSAAGIVSAVNAAMGVALLSDRHIRGEMHVVNDRLPRPPALAYVVRRARKLRNPALDSLVGEIERDTGRHGGLALAG